MCESFLTFNLISVRCLNKIQGIIDGQLVSPRGETGFGFDR